MLRFKHSMNGGGASSQLPLQTFVNDTSDVIDLLPVCSSDERRPRKTPEKGKTSTASPRDVLELSYPPAFSDVSSFLSSETQTGGSRVQWPLLLWGRSLRGAGFLHVIFLTARRRRRCGRHVKRRPAFPSQRETGAIQEDVHAGAPALLLLLFVLQLRV